MQGFCPNCNANLAEENNTILTEESQIFKGHNVYCMCKQCGYVMVYNKDRDLIFSLDRFKDDEEIISEIQELLSETGHGEVELVSKLEDKADEEILQDCKGSCSACSGCSPKKETIQDSVENGDLLVVNKETGDMSIIHQDWLDKINIDDYDFYELNKVFVERVVSYKIQRV